MNGPSPSGDTGSQVSTPEQGNTAPPTAGGTLESETTGDPSQAGALPGMRLLLRIDGGFEAVLGILLVLSPATGLFTVLNLPNPASRPVVVVFGLLLLPLLPVLWLASRSPRRWFVLALATANGAGALMFVLWILVSHGAFQPAGAAFVLVLATMLAILAGLQARAALGPS